MHFGQLQPKQNPGRLPASFTYFRYSRGHGVIQLWNFRFAHWQIRKLSIAYSSQRLYSANAEAGSAVSTIQPNQPIGARVPPLRKRSLMF